MHLQAAGAFELIEHLVSELPELASGEETALQVLVHLRPLSESYVTIERATENGSPGSSAFETIERVVRNN